MIPVSLHLPILIGLLVLSAVRNGWSFPSKLITMYTAFFSLTYFLFIQIDPINPDSTVHLLIDSALAYTIGRYASSLPRVDYIYAFCIVMILTILNNIIIFVAYLSLTDHLAAYTMALGFHQIAEFLLMAADIYILGRIIYGGRNSSTVERVRKSWLYGLVCGIFALPHHKAVYWQKGQKNISLRQKAE